MNNIYDTGIIGAGVSGAFAALRIAQKHPTNKTILIELGHMPGKRRRMLEGWLGCLPTSDGKLYPDNLNIVSGITGVEKAYDANNWVMEILSKASPMKLIKDTLPNVSLQKKIKNANFNIKQNNYIQWKPEHIHSLSKTISEEIEKVGNVKFEFDNEVFKINKKKDFFIISTSNDEIICKNVILCVGRSGWRWATSLYKELGITVSDDIAKYGVRIEISAQHMKDFNKSHCSLIKKDLEIGPFCWNGTIIPEDHADLVISAFRSNEDRWKTDKVSFSLFSEKYFPNAGVYQADRLGKLAFLLFNDRVSKEKIKLLLKNNSQLNLLPEYLWVKDAILQLDSLIPNLSSRGYFHVPNIYPLASKINLNINLETEISGLYVAGESGNMPGILSAAISGVICADSVCK